MANVSVAVVQMQPILGDLEANLYRMADTCRAICSEEKTDLIDLSGVATTGIENGVNFNRMAERVPGHQFNVLATKAADFSTHIVFAPPTKEKIENIFYNRAVVIGPDGELMGEYRKVAPERKERLSFRPGYRCPVSILVWHAGRPDWLGFGISRGCPSSLVLTGAEDSGVPSAYGEPYVDEWRAFCVARAWRTAPLCSPAAISRG